MKRRPTFFLALLLSLALLAPAGAQALPRGFFGIVPQTPLSGEDAVRMRVGGVDTIRVPVAWSAIEPSAQGGYDWRALDATVALAARERIEVLPFLYSTPGWLTGNWRRMSVDSWKFDVP